MKRLVSFLVSVIFFLDISLAYTVTLRIKQMDLVVSEEVGNVVELEPIILEVTDWVVKSGGVTITDNKFTMPANDVVIEAVVPLKQYLLTIESMFFVRKENKTECDSVTVSAITENGEYSFTGWTATGLILTEEQKTSPSITFIMPEKNVTLVANYKKANTNTLTVEFPTFTTLENKKVGTSVTVTSKIAPTGTSFSSWTADGITLTEEQKTSPSITFTMPDNSVTLVSNYN